MPFKQEGLSDHSVAGLCFAGAALSASLAFGTLPTNRVLARNCGHYSSRVPRVTGRCLFDRAAPTYENLWARRAQLLR